MYATRDGQKKTHSLIMKMNKVSTYVYFIQSLLSNRALLLIDINIFFVCKIKLSEYTLSCAYIHKKKLLSQQ